MFGENEQAGPYAGVLLAVVAACFAWRANALQIFVSAALQVVWFDCCPSSDRLNVALVVSFVAFV